jgi:hypothetical protein
VSVPAQAVADSASSSPYVASLVSDISATRGSVIAATASGDARLLSSGSRLASPEAMSLQLLLQPMVSSSSVSCVRRVSVPAKAVADSASSLRLLCGCVSNSLSRVSPVRCCSARTSTSAASDCMLFPQRSSSTRWGRAVSAEASAAIVSGPVVR